MLKNEILPAEGSSIRLVYRHLPLRMHDWAREAAESAACAYEQGNEHF